MVHARVCIQGPITSRLLAMRIRLEPQKSSPNGSGVEVSAETHDLAPLVDESCGAVRSSERAEVALPALTPEKVMAFRVAKQVRETHYRATVVYTIGSAKCPPKVPRSVTV